MQQDLLTSEMIAPPKPPDVQLGPRSIVSRITGHAAARPRHAAVVDDGSAITYRELDILSRRLAATLIDAGAGPDCCVGLFLDRSVEFVIAALAALRAGAAYLPLDPCTPADRAAAILADAGASVLLTHRRKTRDWPNGLWRIVEIDDAPDASARDDSMEISAADIASAATGPLEAEPESLAYIVYTSGSSGRPKGVEITHANLLNLIEWHQAAFEITSSDRASQIAGLGFDATAWEIWPHLTAGATLYIADEMTRRSPQTLRDWLVAMRITVGFAPTILAEQLLQARWPEETSLRLLLTGADVLHRRPPAGLPFVLVNNYGPTECTVVATSGTVSPDTDIAGPPSIGRPIDNATALILDEHLRPVPPGEAGELCLAGALVGRGYRNLPQLTASRFVDYVDPSGMPTRIYRTGDRARLLANGEIAFLGRLDAQIKIRGYRIEPGEIVAWLDRFPGVDASAVAAVDSAAAGNASETNGARGPVLIGWIVPAHDAKFTAGDLREFLAGRLPDYMIPAQFVRVAELPLNANGKLEKAALPPPSAENLLPNREAASMPAACDTATHSHEPIGAGHTQQQIGELVASLLGQPDVAADDNFFMIGGHSMLGVQLVARIRDLFGVKLTLRQLFTAPTVAALSAEVVRLIEANHG
ncbi:MAG TPA: amino acid adenylation domain-containing protein [Pirellulales bacterium]|jgi:amino acid adenylation domain-containing protein|nr:amino acid adenylation domain-containing protein [Pirellulales bacterium]